MSTGVNTWICIIFLHNITTFCRMNTTGTTDKHAHTNCTCWIYKIKIYDTLKLMHNGGHNNERKGTMSQIGQSSQLQLSSIKVNVQTKENTDAMLHLAYQSGQWDPQVRFNSQPVMGSEGPKTNSRFFLYIWSKHVHRVQNAVTTNNAEHDGTTSLGRTTK